MGHSTQMYSSGGVDVVSACPEILVALYRSLTLSDSRFRLQHLLCEDNSTTLMVKCLVVTWAT